MITDFLKALNFEKENILMKESMDDICEALRRKS